AAVRQVEAAVAGTRATDPLLPRKLAEMPRRTNSDKTDRHPTATARRRVELLRVQVEPAHFSGARIAVPGREPKRRRVELRVRRRRLTEARRAEIRRSAEAVDPQQGREARLKPLELGSVLAGHEAARLIPTLEPVVKSADDVGRSATVGIYAAR